jgi:hypothetical protein
MKIIKPKSLEEFIEIFNLLYNSGNDYYRGQADAKWDIIPGLARNKNIFSSFFDVESQLNNNFVEKINDLRLNHLVPIVEDSYHESWQLLMASQHYGLPTRFLDFSNDKFVALGFAIFDSQNLDKDSSIIIYNNADKNQINDEKFFKTPFSSFEKSFFMQAPIFKWKVDNDTKLAEIRKFIQGSKFFYRGNKNIFCCLSLDNEHSHNLMKLIIPKKIKQNIAEYYIKNENIVNDLYRGKNEIDYCCSVFKNDFMKIKY